MGLSLCTIEQSQAFGGDIILSLFYLHRQSPLGRYDHMVYVWYESYESVVLETDRTKMQNEFRQRNPK